MKRSSLPLAFALSCLLPFAALAKEPKEPTPPRNQKAGVPVMNQKQAEALNKCMTKCQEPMQACMDACKNDQECSMDCGGKFTTCLSKTCGDQLPKPPEQPR